MGKEVWMRKEIEYNISGGMLELNKHVLAMF
jgi:hypothetical protein